LFAVERIASATFIVSAIDRVPREERDPNLELQMDVVEIVASNS
jgi:hypothetical protein